MSLDLSLEMDGEEVFDVNVTHNLNNMARECGLYNAMWRPESHGITYAKEAIPEVAKGVEFLLRNKRYYQRFEPENGWGKYEHLLEAAVAFCVACNDHPKAVVLAHR